MQAKPEYRDRATEQVAILDALADRTEEGMTIFELRSHVDEDIDTIEAALGELKEDGLIDVSGEETEEGRTVIRPEDHVVGPPDEGADEGFFEELRRRLPF